MEGSMMENGKQENNMASENIQMQWEMLGLEDGKMEQEWSGLIHMLQNKYEIRRKRKKIFRFIDIKFINRPIYI